ncbi:adhesion G-protein coupled receptor D1-like [Ruditapes philippinarum]|uniref:adhesion G-protein coupled receptor D1-like n=1 Tax=Ruditapes philippinarum TaxID=129788 RepID=UPI00295AA95A|nr:adhesion G-protein coupled receptor D1-like [Ruditapes philippinarum]
MGLSWLLGIFNVNESFYFIQYLFAILNGLQGFCIFLFHCLLNKKVRNAYKFRARKRPSTYFSTDHTSKGERNTKSKDTSGSFNNATTETRDIGHDRELKIPQESFPYNPGQDGSLAEMLNTGTMRRSASFSTEPRGNLTSYSLLT